MNEENERKLSVENIWTTIYCCCLFLVFPLFVRDGYVNIMEAKANFCLVTTGIYLIGTISIAVVKKVQEGTNIFILGDSLNITDSFCIVLMMDIVLGGLLNKLNPEVLWASKGKLFGFIFLMMCCIAYFFISRTFRMNQGILWGLLFGSILTAVFVICSRFGADIFHFYDIIVKNQRSVFLGTLGQINIVASFFCVLIPFWMGCYLYSKEIVSKLLFGSTLFLSITAGLSSNSDSIFLGIAGAYLFCLWFAFEDLEKLSAYFQCVSMLFLSASFVGICTYIVKHRMNFTVKWDILQQQFLKYILAYFIIAVFLSVSSILVKKANLTCPLIKARRIILAIVIILFILGIAIVTINDKKLEKLNVIQQYLVFNDSWGSNRGYVWKRTVRLFGKVPLWKKIVGCGMGMFPSFFKAFHADSIKQFGYYFVDAHNEFLQFLVTTGIIGCISYFGMIITTFIRNLLFIRNRKKSEKSGNELSVIVPAILFVWLLQGLVNSPNVFITPYLFLFIGMGQNIVTEERKKMRS